MIENLTDKQTHLMAILAAEYEAIVLSGDDSYDVEEIIKGIDFIYSLAGLKSPEIVICNSPMEMAIEAKLKPGETIDHLGNGYDSGWTAFYDFFQQIGIEYDNDTQFNKWRDFIKKSGVFATVLCENVAFVCIRPNKVSRNKDGDLHCVDAMAITWRDGYGEFFLNGVSVDGSLVMTPAEKLDATMLFKEKNVEVRREIVRKIGVERVCQKLNAKYVDKDGEYDLIILDLGDGRQRPYLKMKNPSIATYHIEGVEPSIRTVKAALAWRNGIDAAPRVLT